MKRKKKTISIIISLVFVIICAMPAFAYSDGRFIASTDLITREQFNTVLNILSAHMNDSVEGQTPLYPTGIYITSDDDAMSKRVALNCLFGGYGDVCFDSFNISCSSCYVAFAKPRYGGFSTESKGSGSGRPQVFVGFCPGSMPIRAMTQHAQVWEALSQIAATAPADDIAAYQYFNNALCDLITYGTDADGTCQTSYGGIFNKCGNCMSYSAAFFTLCFMTGRKCLVVSGSDHRRNVVFINGVPKWVDVCWNDAGNRNEYFLTDLTSEEIVYITTPGTGELEFR